MPDIAIMALAAALTLVVAWAARLKTQSKEQDNSKGQNESVHDLARISVFLAFIAVSAFFFYHLTQIQVLGHILQGTVFAILGGIVFGFLIFLWWPLHQKTAADDFDRLRYRTLSIMIGVVVFLSLAWNDLSAALSRLVRGAHEVSVAGVVTIRASPDRAEGAGMLVSPLGSPARELLSTRENSLVSASVRELGRLVGMDVRWPRGFEPTEHDLRPSCLRTDFFKENSSEFKALSDAILGQSSAAPGEDIERIFPLAAHALYIAFLYHRYVLQPSRMNLEYIANASEFLRYLNNVEKASFFKLSGMIEPLLPALCLLLDLRHIFACLITYTEVVSDTRLLLLDIHHFLRALEAFSLTVSQGRSSATGAPYPVSEDKLQEAIKKLGDDVIKILSNLSPAARETEQNSDWKETFQKSCKIATHMPYSFIEFFKDRQPKLDEEEIIRQNYSRENLKNTIFF